MAAGLAARSKVLETNNYAASGATELHATCAMQEEMVEVWKSLVGRRTNAHCAPFTEESR